MGACANGARPNATGAGLQVWLDRAQLAADVLSIVRSYAPLAYAALVASLVSIDGICAENPDPPEPITAADIIAQTAAIPTAGALGSPAIISKLYSWLRYQQFLTYCECVPYTPPSPELNCSVPVSFDVTAQGQIVSLGSVTIDPLLQVQWPVFGNGDWTFFSHGSFTLSGGATPSSQHLIEYLSTAGTWITVDSTSHMEATGGACVLRQLSASEPKFPNPVQLRFRVNGGNLGHIANLQYCFCAPDSVPPPLPPQPPLTTTPLPPVLLCGDEDICGLLNELAHRLTLVATQVSDIQARLGGTDVLLELGRRDVAGEGEATLPVGTRAISIELTALGAGAYTSALGRPRGLMRVGSVRWFDGTGYSGRTFIDADKFDAPRPQGALSLSWQLLPGTIGVLKYLG